MNAALYAALSGVVSAASSLLSLLGLLMGFVFIVWGVFHVLAILQGWSSSEVAYRIGRLFGDLIYEDRYQEYKARRDRARSFARRYRSER